MALVYFREGLARSWQRRGGGDGKIDDGRALFFVDTKHSFSRHFGLISCQTVRATTQKMGFFASFLDRLEP